ncbi:hypothetical protein V8J82_12795 [Gymnodinialimonas sp. 2305UL16-5]|uniref:hypothetical protein n=1 Tax=Gymnodinialimonas mytili TaxID=3126503 RepID=UPI00309DD8B2
MFRSLLTALLLALSTLPALADGHGCQTVRFPSGAYIHAVHGQANPYQSQCYVLDVRRGQQARVRVVYGPVFVSTTHTQGTYQDVQFYTVNGRLHVYVHTDYAGPQPFSIEFTFI